MKVTFDNNLRENSKKIFPFFDLGEFVLREKRDKDVEDFFKYYSDPEVNRFILCNIPQDLEEAKRDLHYWRQVFYSGDGIYFAIADKASDKIIGSIGVTGHNFYHKRIEISYDLSKEYWRRGIITKAIKVVNEFSFRQLNVNRIEAMVATENTVSKNLLLKCGYTLEGKLRQHRYHKGTFFDVYVFSLLRSDYL